MKTYRKFIASSEYFLGYEVLIDITVYNSIDTIITYFYEHLMNTLVINNFEIFIEYLKQRKLHIHDFVYEDIKNSHPSQIFYICDRC
jgi:hypothetical protein